jgi:hypothetical protein
MEGSKELTRMPAVIQLDGFNDYTSEVEGESDALDTSSHAIVGDKIKFIDPRWLLGGTDITGMLLTLIGTRNVVTKWGHDNKPLVTRILLPGKKFPNFKKLNDECDRSEWRDSFGKMVGPGSGQHCLYFIDDNYRRLTWPSPTGTIGSCIAVDEIVADIQVARKFRGQDAFAVVELSHTNFRTCAGLKQRPKLVVKQLVKLGLDRVGALFPAAPASGHPPSTSGSPASPAPTSTRTTINRDTSTPPRSRASFAVSSPTASATFPSTATCRIG